MVGSQPGMHGRKLEGSDVLETEDDELRLAIEASLADMHQVRPSAPGAIEDPEIYYKVCSGWPGRLSSHSTDTSASPLSRFRPMIYHLGKLRPC